MKIRILSSVSLPKKSRAALRHRPWLTPACLTPAGLVPAAVFLILLAGCGVIDLSPPGGVITNPGVPGQILEIGEEITVTFPRPVDTRAAESAVRIYLDSAYINGSFRWDGAAAAFIPDEDLKIGSRYELIVEGSVPGADGRIIKPSVYVPFYVGVLPVAPPKIISVGPDRLGGDSTAISVLFSLPMDPESVEITSVPEMGFEAVWAPGGTTLELVPGKEYPNGEVVKLSFSSTAADTRGVLLSGTRDFSFPVEYDTCPPGVETVGYALSDWRAGFPLLGTDLESIGPEDSIRIGFTEAMDRKSTEAGIFLLPEPLGHRSWISDTDCVIVPELGWETGVEYVLIIGPPGSDTGGNPLREEITRRFTPRFGPFTLEEVRPLPPDGPARREFSTHEPLMITPALYGGDYTLTLVFSEPAPSDRVRSAVQRRVSVRPLYPHSLPAPRITGLSWPDCRTLTISLTGFERSGPVRTNFYRFEIGPVPEVRLESASQLIEAAE